MCGLVLDHERVSRRHALVRFKAAGRTGTTAGGVGLGRWFITDLGSTAGTYVCNAAFYALSLPEHLLVW